MTYDDVAILQRALAEQTRDIKGDIRNLNRKVDGVAAKVSKMEGAAAAAVAVSEREHTQELASWPRLLLPPLIAAVITVIGTLLITHFA